MGFSCGAIIHVRRTESASVREKAEKLLARSVRAALADVPVGGSIHESAHMADVKLALQFWTPQVLGWDEESLDGWRFSVATKTAEGEVELLGLGLLISDQRWTPMRIVIRVSRTADAVVAYYCGLGEPGNGKAGIVRLPYRSQEAQQMLDRPPDIIRATRWAFSARAGRVAPTDL